MNSGERYKYTQKSEMILMSKKIQCDCLIFISRLELDGRAELFLSKLKREYELQNDLIKAEESKKDMEDEAVVVVPYSSRALSARDPAKNVSILSGMSKMSKQKSIKEAKTYSS